MLTEVPYPAASPDRLTILHVLALGPVGGLLRVVEALAVGQRRRGHDVYVMAVQDAEDPEHPMLASLERAGVGVIPVVLPGRGYLRERARVREHCRRLRPDVVHTHGYRPDVVDGPVARRLGIPAVTTVHGFTGGDWKNRLYERLQRRAYRRFDAVVAVSRRLAGELARSGVSSARVVTVPNAWGETSVPLARAEARRALALPAEGFVVGWVGRVSQEKGADVLLAALPQLADLPLSVSIVGDGQERSRLEQRTAGSAPVDRIRWHGMVADAGRYFPAFDAYVLSSRTEGTPIALFEAMAAGTPIVATRVGGVPDVVTPAEGWLVEPEDPAAIAAAIRAIHADPAAAAARARAARERLRKEFAFEPWLDRYDALYRALRRRRGEGNRKRVYPV